MIYFLAFPTALVIVVQGFTVNIVLSKFQYFPATFSDIAEMCDRTILKPKNQKELLIYRYIKYVTCFIKQSH